ncbi:tetratricopeptide repeat protein [Lamprobacter modestohalophilus]|nr:tetratricopeptide repeat protein [Lamprobacter modestohalophilus]
MPSHTAQRIPATQRQRFERRFQKGDDQAAEQEAEALTRRYPQDPFGWHALAQVRYRQDQPETALKASQLACEFDGAHPKAEHQLLLGKIHFQLDQLPEAEQALTRAAELAPDTAETQLMLGHTYHAQQREDAAIEALDKALALAPTSMNVLAMRITVFALARRYATMFRDCETLMALKPQEAVYYNLVGTKYQDIGEYETARTYYNEALRRDPEYFGAASNILTGMHYDPAVSARQIYETALSWQARFPVPPQPPEPRDIHPDRRLRVGLLSSGFRLHPVGYMILPGVLNTKRSNLEFYYYTLDRKEDLITKQLMRTGRYWKAVYRHSHDELEAMLREDQLDILIDMSGHNDGNRLPVLVRKPAPLIIKWVGGQINTTGLEAIDYFLSDAIETPAGVDDWYVEKLIRLPDDYICYSIPPYVPQTFFPDPNELPALSNGYLTLGCLNNPTKLNPELLTHWGRLMQALPGSHLLLKSGQYEDEDFCQRIRDRLAEHGIGPERIEMEGPAKQKEFLRTYRRIDIALDPWPYSGGLTTCEALMMGVPVVTYPGPTFAGRHAATHLVNAGYPEWVCESWEAYHQRVLDLAGDLAKLASIRRRLRQRVTASPLCDGLRFAENLDGALRAVWQRYCEGKTPAALTFTAQGECQFENEATPVALQHPQSYLTPRALAERRFNWQLPGKLVAVDNRAKLLREEGIDTLLKLDAFGIIAFDPGSLVEQPERFANSADVQLVPHALLGDGQPATLHACLDPALSSPLEPLPVAQLPPSIGQGAQVLAKLPISTVALNSIAGLESLDWLILDHLSDANAILENGDQALKDSLLIQVRIAFQPTHQRQPNLAELQHWTARHGFRFYRFNDLTYESHLPAREELIKTQGSELIGADVLFLPSLERMAMLSDAQRLKLAFLLHTVFNVRDLSYALLAEVDDDKAEDYLLAQGMVKAPEPAAELESEPTTKTEALADPERSDLDTGDKPASSSATAEADDADEFIFE